MQKTTYPELVLAIAPMSRGFGFVLFEGPLSPCDWGVVHLRGYARNASILERVQTMIERYHPDTLVFEDFSPQKRRRPSRLRALVRSLRHMAATHQMEVVRYDRAAIRNAFAPVGARTKYEIAQAVAREVPAFKHRLPPYRKIWMSEDPRQSLFDAAALGLTHYDGKGQDGGQTVETVER